MTRYHISQQVNWGAVTKTLRRAIRRHISQYRQTVAHDDLCEAREICYGILKESLKNYQELRKFLGYSQLTKIEKEAEELLQASHFSKVTKSGK